MYEFTALASFIIMNIAGLDYIRRAWKKEINPAIATWILMSVVFILSVWMYMGSPNRSWTANISIIGGLVSSLTVSLSLIGMNIYRGTLKVAFDKIQIGCLFAGGLVTVFWIITRQPLISYCSVQCIALVAHSATMIKLSKAKGSTEAYCFWVCLIISSLFALYPAYIKNDAYSWIQLGRNIPSTSIIILLIYKAKQRMELAIA